MERQPATGNRETNKTPSRTAMPDGSLAGRGDGARHEVKFVDTVIFMIIDLIAVASDSERASHSR